MALAFPLTPILDDFSTSPIATAWRQNAFGGDAFTFSTSGGVMVPSGNTSGAVLMKTGPDCEAYVTVSTLPTSGNLVQLGIRSDEISNMKETYYLRVTPSTTTWDFRRVLAGGGSASIATFSTTTSLAAGDSIGFRAMGTTFQAWKKTGGTWTQVGSDQTNTLIKHGGWIGLEAVDTVTRFDDFGGGDITAYTYKSRPLLLIPSRNGFLFVPDIPGLEATPNMAGPAQSVAVTGLGSAQAFSTPTVIPGAITVSVSGLGSAQAFASVTILPGGTTVSITGLGSAQAFSSPSVTNATQVVTPAGLGSAQAFATPQINMAFSITGLGSAQAFTTPTALAGNVNVSVTGLGSAQAFAAPGINQRIFVTGLGSAQAFASVTIIPGGTTRSVAGLNSAQAFAVPNVSVAGSGGGFTPAVHGGGGRSFG